MKLKTYMYPYRYRYLLGLICMLIAVGLDLMAPVVTQHIIDQVIVGGNGSILMPLLFGLLGIGVFRALFGYIREFTFDWIGMSATNKMRKDVFDHVQTLSAGFFQEHNTGELMTRIKDDVDKVCVAIGFIGMLAVEAVTHTVLVMVCMFRLSPVMTLIPLLFLPVIGFLAVRMEQKLGTTYEAISDQTASLNTVAQENIAGVRTVKAFAREKFELKKFRAGNKKYYDLNMDQARTAAFYQPLISGLGKILLLAVVITGGLLVIGHKMTLGTLGACLEYANNMIWPMEIVGWLSNELASAVASWKKIKKIMAAQPEITNPQNPEEPEKIEGELAFEHVGLELDGQRILTDISFELKKGKTIGIMGMTGAGKSMLVNLAQRFYDPTEGCIRLDRTDIKSISLSSLRRSIAVVSQDVFLFSDSIDRNIKMGKKEEVSRATVSWALETASAAEFVSELEQQEETVIGERGVGLSGGQKQRLGIARAIAKKAPVLILDDSTSALDMETELQLQKDLEKLKGISRLIIAHRVSSVKSADEILILHNGAILERGTHDELMAQKGEYYRTWCVQYGEEVQQCR